MGISAAIAGIGAAATAASTINNIAGGANPVSSVAGAAGNLVNAAAYQQAGAAMAGSAQTALNQQQTATQAETNALSPFVIAAPNIEAGTQNLLGLGPNGTAGELSALQATPGYQFTLQQGLQSTQSAISAMGLADSGSAIKAADQYTAGLAGQTYQGIVSNYINAGNQALSGATNYANVFQNAQNAQNNLNLDIGNANAYGLTGMANALNAGIQGTNSMPGTTTPGSVNVGPNYQPGQTNPITAGQMAALQGNTNEQYGANALALQNPYQINAPSITPQPIDTNQLGVAPTLPTG